MGCPAGFRLANVEDYVLVLFFNLSMAEADAVSQFVYSRQTHEVASLSR